MSKVISISHNGQVVLITLECGHIQEWDVPQHVTAEQWSEQIQQGQRPVLISKTRLRCEKKHEK